MPLAAPVTSAVFPANEPGPVDTLRACGELDPSERLERGSICLPVRLSERVMNDRVPVTVDGDTPPLRPFVEPIPEESCGDGEAGEILHVRLMISAKGGD